MKDRVLADRYRLTAPLGRGGMGTVWAAMDLRLDVLVAVKLLDPSIAEDEKALVRFFREAKTIAQLRSRHVIRVFDCALDQGTPFIAMELLEGRTLRDRLQQTKILCPKETFAILGDVALAMHVAHQRGIVHRDLKPDNIFMANEDNEIVVKVLDFGIAKRLLKPSGPSIGALTEIGEIFGTPSYMSPEQIDSRAAVDHRTDIWALSIIAFECLTGRVPFIEDTLQEQFLAICMRPIPVPSSIAKVPTGFDCWFGKGTSRESAQRFADAMEARKELGRICSQSATSTLYEVSPALPTADATMVSSTSPAGTLRVESFDAASASDSESCGGIPDSSSNSATAAPVSSSKSPNTVPLPHRVQLRHLIPIASFAVLVASFSAYILRKPGNPTPLPVHLEDSSSVARTIESVRSTFATAGQLAEAVAQPDRADASVSAQNVAKPEPVASVQNPILAHQDRSHLPAKPAGQLLAPTHTSKSPGNDRTTQPPKQSNNRALPPQRRPQVDLGL